MTRRPTFSELRWPNDPADADLPVQWARNISVQVLRWTWRGFDRLRSNHLERVDLSQPLEQLERDLTSKHYVEIQLLFQDETAGFASVVLGHEWPEMASRTSAAAKPPAYDLAFISIENPRWAWPIEAKVVASPNALAEYLKDVNDKFIGGVAAPVVGEGAMIAYLLTSGSSALFLNLTQRIDQDLKMIPEFQDRPHRVSYHPRATAPDLRLHHMLMLCV